MRVQRLIGGAVVALAVVVSWVPFAPMTISWAKTAGTAPVGADRSAANALPAPSVPAMATARSFLFDIIGLPPSA